MRNDHSTSGGRRTAEIALPARRLTLAAHKPKTGRYSMPSHRHVEAELVCVDYGQLRVVIDGKAVTLSPGQACLIPSRAVHRLSSMDAKPSSFLNIMFSGRSRPELVRRRLWLSQSHMLLLGRIKYEAEHKLRHGSELMLLGVNTLLLELEREAAMSHRPREAGPEATVGFNRAHYRHDKVASVLRLLETTCAQPLDVDAAARHVSLSVSHLRRLVRQQTGKSLSGHLRDIRVEAAKRMLASWPMNVDELARRVGYQSPPHFCTVFKKLTGKTPSEYARTLEVASAVKDLG